PIPTHPNSTATARAEHLLPPAQGYDVAVECGSWKRWLHRLPGARRERSERPLRVPWHRGEDTQSVFPVAHRHHRHSRAGVLRPVMAGRAVRGEPDTPR